MSNPTELPDLEAERLLFEADTAETFAAATFGRFPVGGNYNVTWVQEQWNGWQRAIRARRDKPEGEAWELLNELYQLNPTPEAQALIKQIDRKFELVAAALGKPEGEAPQAEAVAMSEDLQHFLAIAMLGFHGRVDVSYDAARTVLRNIAEAPHMAKYFAPAAQHAVIGAQAAGDVIPECITAMDRHYPLPVTTDLSIAQRAMGDRNAFRKGWVERGIAAQSQGAQALMLDALKSCKSSRWKDVDGDWVESQQYDKEKVHAALAALAAKAEAPAPVAYLIRDNVGNKGWSEWKPCTVDEYELRKPHADIFQFKPLVVAQQAAAPGAVGDGFALQFSREDWGVIFDGVMLEIDRSEKRKQVNSESNSDARAEQGRAILAAIRSRSSAPSTPEAPTLAYGHRDDFYLLENGRRLGMEPISRVRDMPNWVLAKELFATGSASAHQICRDAGIDPDGFKVQRAAQIDGGQGGSESNG